jgi:mono/diheme cytochrome c family protein
MRLSWISVLVLTFLSFSNISAQSLPTLHEKRKSPSDLEVGGEIANLPPDSTRYLAREELLAMPQVNFSVTGDPNFADSTQIRGVMLEELARQLGKSPASDLIIAICDDRYRAYYPHNYLAIHHPVLVLEVNGQPPAGWPKDAPEHKYDMGPYMISHAKFKPNFKILTHTEQAQIPWGVVRLEFREVRLVFGAIAPRGPHATDSAVQAGYRIAQQNCYQCHNLGREAGQKSSRSWESLGAEAAASPEFFAAYVRAPQVKNPQAQMPANPEYNDATLDALTAYFRTFSAPKKQ